MAVPRYKLIALWLAPALALLVYLLLPDQYRNEQGYLVELSPAARAVAAVGLWMAIWWMTEAISVYATALLPLALFPLTGALPSTLR